MTTEVENLFILGCRLEVLLELIDGTISGPAVARETRRTIDFLRFLANRSGVNPTRPLSPEARHGCT